MKASTRKLVLERDPYCFHCGESNDLVVHHRRNRGHGGSKLLDKPEWLMAVCASYNGEMESDAWVAIAARALGHKLRSWESHSLPVFDVVTQLWYVLKTNGTKEIYEDEEGHY